MLQPARTKFRKQHKGRIHGPAKAGTILNFGAYGLKALEPNRITAREIEAAGRLDLARRDAIGLQRLEPIGAEIENRPRLGWAVDAALVLLAEFRSCGLKHRPIPFL